MRIYRRLLIAMIFIVPILSGCFLDGRGGSDAGTGSSENSDSEVTGNGTTEVATSIDTASSQLVFGGATFDTSTWK